MLKSLTSFFVRLIERWIPDPFVIAIILTAITMLFSVTLAGFPLDATIMSWGNGIWGLLAFTMQITLTFVLGHALAHTGPVEKLLRAIAGKVKSARQAYLMVCFVGGAAALLSWGLSLVTAAILARTTAETCERRGIRVHYPLLVAAGYSGFVIWHQGLSGSITLAINTPGHFLESSIGLISVMDTIFTPWNMAVALLILFTLPFLLASLAPGEAETRVLPAHLMSAQDQPGEESPYAKNSPAARLEGMRLLNGVVVLAGAGFLFLHFITNNGSLNLNILNFGFLMLGIGLARSPEHYVNLLGNAAKVVGPFLLQYPFYAGVMGVMRESGLGAMVVAFFVQFSSAESLPVTSFLSAGILNIFVPSGGGQWAIQGPIVTEAALALGADIPRVAMAVAMGDQWTNMIQPLFAIPALAIAGLHIREIMGYCVITLLFTGAIFLTALSFF